MSMTLNELLLKVQHDARNPYAPSKKNREVAIKQLQSDFNEIFTEVSNVAFGEYKAGLDDTEFATLLVNRTFERFIDGKK